jgi:transcriptional regulator with XRE-family HTH domain
MSQVDQFLGALKRSLKARNILYRDLAETLDLSESSVKRILSSKSLSLERLEEICKACDLSFAEICRNAQFEEESHVLNLSAEQEKALAENPRLLHYYILLHDGKKPQKIEKEYEITNNESKKLLLQLDRLNLIELHPRDRVKIKGVGTLRFKREGAVGKAMFTYTKNNYLNHDFNGESDFIRFSLVGLTPQALSKFKVKIEKLHAEIQEEARFISENEQEAEDMGILVAFRPWQYSHMGALKKK